MGPGEARLSTGLGPPQCENRPSLARWSGIRYWDKLRTMSILEIIIIIIVILAVLGFFGRGRLRR
jgi:hypothetical protein